MKTTIAMSLVSHTNVGKTTLARTLLRRDVGEVLDQAHVTETNTVHELFETPDANLQLWDTPGFGDTARLRKRLRNEKNPLGWFLHQVWDRTADRPLWCSQEALRNVKDDADIVLYLVNASEDPDDAGYLSPELEILSWCEKPVLFLLNQTGGAPAADELEEAWRAHAAAWDVVRGVLPLDAFNRCWAQEVVLFRAVAELLPGQKRAAMVRVADAWQERNQDLFAQSVSLMADSIARAATDREPVHDGLLGKAEKKRAAGALAERLAIAERELWDRVIALQSLDGSAATEARAALEHFVFQGTDELDPNRASIVGGVVSGALGGLAADALAGGLTFGGGAVAGAILGALGGRGFARGLQLVRTKEEPLATWNEQALNRLVQQALLRYLEIAHFGRGQGEYRETEGSASRWQPVVEAEFERFHTDLERHWKTAAEQGPTAVRGLAGVLERDLGAMLQRILEQAYPEGLRPARASS